MSGEIIKVEFQRERRCEFCGKRKVTRICDMPIGELHYSGHPPRRSGGSGPMSELLLCGREMCDECAYPVEGEIDLCPHCFLRVRLTQKGRKKKVES